MRRIGWLFGLALVMAACGGSGASGASDTPTTTPTATSNPAITEAPATTTPVATEAPASLVPGPIAYRVANLTAGPVDVYLRTQGLVRAFPAALGVAAGSVTDDLYPPEPGAVVVLPAGRADPTCVSGCAFLAESSTGFGDGDRRLLVIRAAGATEYWEHADPASIGRMSNALSPADSTEALLIVEAQGVTDASFGIRVAFADAAGCAADTTASTPLLGGTAVLTFVMDAASVDVVVHDNRDSDCSAAPVGGPFPATGPAGSRTLLLLWGTMGEMQGLAVPLP